MHKASIGAYLSYVTKRRLPLLRNIPLVYISSVFALPGESLGVTDKVSHHIALQPGTRPSYTRAYRLPHSQKAVVEEMIQGMLKENIIQESSRPRPAPPYDSFSCEKYVCNRCFVSLQAYLAGSSGLYTCPYVSSALSNRGRVGVNDSLVAEVKMAAACRPPYQGYDVIVETAGLKYFIFPIGWFNKRLLISIMDIT